MIKKLITTITLILIFFLPAACSTKEENHFFISISENAQPLNISASTWKLGVEDILSYDWENHEILITEQAAQRFEELKPPVNGLYFAVFVGEETIYDGYIWPAYSSLSYDGIIIEYPLLSENRLSIKKGYPGEGFFSGEDPRNDQRIYESLLNDNKL